MTRHLLALPFLALFAAPAAAAPCAPDNGGLKLSDGFCATIFAENLGPTRHIAFGPDGTLYANTRSNPRRPGNTPEGGMLAALKDTNGDGKADSVQRFGDHGDKEGGTGLAVFDGHVYAEAKGAVVRWKLDGAKPTGAAQTIVDKLPMIGGHTMHSIAIAADGSLYVNSGSASNACQREDRKLHSPGQDPCAELETRAGIWRYDARKMGQSFGPRERFATGLRNTVAMTVGPDNQLYAVIHGRDQLHQNWPEKFDERQGSELPSEVTVHVERGKNYGWPYCYFDQEQKKYVLAPEYGGDGKKTDRCAETPMPIYGFPGHWAPNGIVLTSGANARALPDRYRQGAFIAFHGSWNRDKQQGYFVVFLPMSADGRATDEPEVVADNFTGGVKAPNAPHRPCGIALGPDGALYVSDDVGGRIWRIASR